MAHLLTPFLPVFSGRRREYFVRPVQVGQARRWPGRTRCRRHAGIEILGLVPDPLEHRSSPDLHGHLLSLVRVTRAVSACKRNPTARRESCSSTLTFGEGRSLPLLVLVEPSLRCRPGERALLRELLKEPRTSRPLFPRSPRGKGPGFDALREWAASPQSGHDRVGNILGNTVPEVPIAASRGGVSCVGWAPAGASAVVSMVHRLLRRHLELLSRR